jgi:hypothetical protein
MGSRGSRPAGIEIETVPGRGVTAVVIRLNGVVDATTVTCLRGAVSCLASRPLVIDLERCTLATRELGPLLADLRGRAQPCCVACPRLGARLLLGRRGEEPLDWIFASVGEALAAVGVPGEAPPPAAQPRVVPSPPAAWEAAYT